MSELKPNGYFVDKTGTRVEIVDAQARKEIEALKQGGSGGSGLPATSEGNMFLVTDSNGEPTWAKRTDVAVVMPETELESVGSSYGAILPESSMMVVGKTYTVTYNGDVYECEAYSADVLIGQGMNGAIVFGNIPAITVDGDNGVPFVAFVGSQIGMTFIECMPLDGASSITMGIVGPGLSAGEVMTIHAEQDGEEDAIVSNTFAQIKAAVDKGVFPVVAITVQHDGLEMTVYLKLVSCCSDGEYQWFEFNGWSSEEWAIYTVWIGDDDYAQFSKRVV